MPPTLEELLISIDARTESLRSELNRSDADVRRFVQKTDGNLSRLDRRFSALGKGVRVALAAFGVTAGVGGLAFFTRGAIAAGDAVDKAAKTAGVGAQRLQELRFAFEQLAGTTDKEVDESIRRFNRRLGLSIQGTGEAKATFQQLGIEFRTTSGHIRSTDDVLEEALEKLAAIESDSIRAAKASQVFGEDAGPRLAAALGQGIDAMNALRDAAPGVLSDAQVEKAAALTDAFGRMASTIGGAVKGALIDATFALGNFFELVERGSELSRLTADLEQARKKISELEGGGQFTAGPLQRAREQETAILAELRALREQQQSVLSEVEAAPYIERATSRSAARERARRAVAEVQRTLLSVDRSQSQDLEPVDISEFVDRGTERGAAVGRARATARAIQIEYLDAADEVEDRWVEASSAMGSSVRSVLVNRILGIEQDWKDLLKRMAVDLATSQLFSLLGGAIGGPIGSFFAGAAGRATGGRVNAGVPYVINERTPRSEAFVADVPGRILTAAQTRQASGGAGMTLYVDARQSNNPEQMKAAVEEGVVQAVRLSGLQTVGILQSRARPYMS